MSYLNDACALPLGGSGAKGKRQQAKRDVAGGMSVNEAIKENGLTGANVTMFRAQMKNDKGPRRLSDYGETGAIARLGRNRNANRSSMGDAKSSNVDERLLALRTSNRQAILGASSAFNSARSRGYSKREAATLATQIAKATRSDNQDRLTRLTRGIFAEFRQR